MISTCRSYTAVTFTVRSYADMRTVPPGSRVPPSYVMSTSPYPPSNDSGNENDMSAGLDRTVAYGVSSAVPFCRVNGTDTRVSCDGTTASTVSGTDISERMYMVASRESNPSLCPRITRSNSPSSAGVITNTPGLGSSTGQPGGATSSYSTPGTGVLSEPKPKPPGPRAGPSRSNPKSMPSNAPPNRPCGCCSDCAERGTVNESALISNGSPAFTSLGTGAPSGPMPPKPPPTSTLITFRNATTSRCTAPPTS